MGYWIYFWIALMVLILHQVPARWFPWVVFAMIIGVLVFAWYMEYFSF